MHPQARKDGLVVKELPDETLVYDRRRHRAHCLNRTAALVFKHSDGRKSVSEIARLVEGELGIALDKDKNDERLVWAALRQLGKADLLEARLVPPLEVGRCSRREMVRRMGLGLAALLPLVTSIVAPTAAEAAATCFVTCMAGVTDFQNCEPPNCLKMCDEFGNCN